MTQLMTNTILPPSKQQMTKHLRIISVRHMEFHTQSSSPPNGLSPMSKIIMKEG
jgi:hypothetical protein|tara:strand:+ start:595 stop:756 length:162 start_codon:yes stop_codon:yes gene_type:complete